MAYYGSFGLSERKELKKKRKNILQSKHGKRLNQTQHGHQSFSLQSNKQDKSRSMNYLIDNNDALRTSTAGRSVLFHLHKPLHLAALRQTHVFFALFLLTTSCAGQESNVIGYAGFPPRFDLWALWICIKHPRIKPTGNRCAFVGPFTRTSQSTGSQDDLNHRLKKKYC